MTDAKYSTQNIGQIHQVDSNEYVKSFFSRVYKTDHEFLMNEEYTLFLGTFQGLRIISYKLLETTNISNLVYCASLFATHSLSIISNTILYCCYFEHSFQKLAHFYRTALRVDMALIKYNRNCAREHYYITRCRRLAHLFLMNYSNAISNKWYQ